MSALVARRSRSSWMHADELDDHELQPGDVIEFRRFKGTYKHFAIYEKKERGISYVIHYSDGADDEKTGGGTRGFSSGLGEIAGKAKVRRDALVNVANGCKCRRNNELDERYQPFEPAMIVARALQRMGQEGYHLIMNNCEHFANFCRYGEERSRQVVTAATGMGVAGAVSIAVGVGAALYLIFGGNSRQAEEREEGTEPRSRRIA